MALNCRKIFVTYGRFQPMTWGHENSFDALAATAKQYGGDYLIYISHSPLSGGTKEKKLKHPIPRKEKFEWMKKISKHSKKIISLEKSSPKLVLQDCQRRNYDEAYYMVGEDEITGYIKDLPTYNGPNGDYSFRHIEVRSTGKRSADGDGYAISGTKMRNWVLNNDVAGFTSGLPKGHGRNSKQISDMMTLIKTNLATIDKTIKL